MTKTQQRAVDFFRRHLEESISEASRRDYGAAVTRFEVEPTDYGCAWITAEIEYAGLGEGNLLRFLTHEHWFVYVGKRGALTAHSYPKSLEQFRGRQHLGINIK